MSHSDPIFTVTINQIRLNIRKTHALEYKYLGWNGFWCCEYLENDCDKVRFPDVMIRRYIQLTQMVDDMDAFQIYKLAYEKFLHLSG